MLDSVLNNNMANTFLAFSHGEIVIPLLILGYIWLDRKIFFQATCLTLVATILNYGLKVTFKIPLPFDPKKFAYPSGHMQFSVALYGYLITQIRKPFWQAMMVIILFGIASALVHFDYHNYFDIVGSIFFSALLIVGYIALSKTEQQYLLPTLTLLISTLLLFYIAIAHEIMPHVWRSYYAIIGAMASEYYFLQTEKTSFKNKIVASLASLMMVLLIQKFFSLMTLPVFIDQVRWAIISAFVPFVLYQLGKPQKGKSTT